MTLWVGVLIGIAALLYPKESEDHHDTDIQSNHTESLSLKTKMIKQFLNVKEIRNTLIFFFVISIISPNLEEFFVYFNEYEHHTKPIFEGYSSVALGVMVMLLTLLYNQALAKRYELRSILLLASVFRVISALVAIF